MSDVPFKMLYHGTEIPMALASGLVGVRQDKPTHAVFPEIGWLVTIKKPMPDGKTRFQLETEDSSEESRFSD